MSGCQAVHHKLRLPVRETTTRYLHAADVVGGTELDTGHYEVAQYSFYSSIPHISDTWYQQEVFLRAANLMDLPIGQPMAVPNALFTVQSYGRATWYFEQFKGISGTVTRLPAPKSVLRLRLALRYLDAKQHIEPLLNGTLAFQLDTAYFQRTHRDYHGEYTDLRLALKELMKVKKLDLTNWAIAYEKRNGRDSGPDTLYRRLNELINLEELSLHLSDLDKLPPGFERLKRLKKLDLSYNRLTTLPPELLGLDSLQELDLAWNRLDSIPPTIARLQSLRTLNLSDNRLQGYPEAVNEMTELDSLSLGNANLRELPASISRLHRLQMLGLDGFWNSKRRNRLTNLNALMALPQLRRLSLADNGLETLPPAIYQLSNLEELNLRYNGLDSVAIDTKRLPKLRKLELR